MGTNDAALSRAELERGLETVPAYARWRALDPGPAAEVDARYAALPATGREMMAAAPRAFVPEGRDLDAAIARGEVELVRTSGTTGPPATLAWSAPWWERSERMGWPLNAVLAQAATGTHREAVLASPRCVGPGLLDRPRTMAERTLGRLLFVNESPDVALWTDGDVRRMCGELQAFAPAVLEADPAYLAALVARAEALGLGLPAPPIVVYTYSLPSRVHLARIGRALPTPWTSSYGSSETGTVFVRCESGSLHQNAASCRVDLAPFAGGTCRLLVTPFAHPWACFLKFDVGDLARVREGPCPCGHKAGLTLSRIEGRASDVTIRSGGSPVTVAELDDAIAASTGSERIVSWRLDQDAAGDVRLRATATGSLDGRALTAALRGTYGAATRIAVEEVAVLPPEPSGKYRLAAGA